ncbi:hypothetical protein ASC77_25565 [Nocardioides sp. Root1257]|uniref:S8 family serine peptidase n=1 Tax=unclassified Nocardioides TaxID=2615069 RepID=UPI0006F5675A|nr:MULTISPECIES: S8 family serine peptidase [unclassified Nocardioides]KQW50697.1 hypothetical protein ASC77_25565 [Nocardioides sp. Root1257]KRC51523.1 hypothetical protein ASE24_25795 [Nocardioides sp. Root224]
MRLTASLAAVVGLASVVVPLGVAPAYAADNVCLGVDESVAPSQTGRASATYDALGIEQAQEAVARLAPAATTPVRVAVLGPGVLGGAIPVHATVVAGGSADEIEDPLGTEVAGLVAGAARPDGQAVGFAPGAEIVDVRVYRNGTSAEDAERPSADALAAGLRRVAELAGGDNIRVAVVPFAVRKDTALRKAVAAVHRAGVVLVAASGDRPDDGTEFATDFATSADDPKVRTEDAGPKIFPAGYADVVAVNSSGDPDGALANVLKNSRTAVAAPSYNAVSYGLNGATCVVQPTSTAAAAGEVAGVLALLAQRFPRDLGPQLVARLVATADGTPDDPTPLTGAGVVQPYEALARPLAPTEKGEVERTVVRTDAETRATAPEPEADLLASTRENAVWWGLIGGGLIVVTLMLRPVLARRRRT